MGRFYFANAAAVVPSSHETQTYLNSHSRIPPDGRVTFSQVFTVVMLFIIGIQGLKLIVPWYDSQRLKGSMQESVNQAPLLRDGDMISAVLAKSKELGIPIAARDIHVERSQQGGVRLWAEYDVTLTLPLGLSHTLSFRPEVKSGRF